MHDLVWPSKLVQERITIEFSFLDLMEFNEVIIDALLTVDVHSGEDTSPHDMLYQSFVLDSPLIRQRVYQGIPGVIYKITCTIFTDLSNTYDKSGYLAILPSDANIPALYATYSTSNLYPIVYAESMSISPIFLGGFLKNTGVYFEFDESFSITPTVVNGLLRYANTAYTYSEILSISPSLINGVLRDTVKSGYMRDSTTIVPFMVTGELKRVIVSGYADESMQITPTLIGGTLT